MATNCITCANDVIFGGKVIKMWPPFVFFFGLIFHGVPILLELTVSCWIVLFHWKRGGTYRQPTMASGPLRAKLINIPPRLTEKEIRR